MLWDPFLYCINDSIQGNSETGNKVFTLPSEVSINTEAGASATGSIFFIDRGHVGTVEVDPFQ